MAVVINGSGNIIGLDGVFSADSVNTLVDTRIDSDSFVTTTGNETISGIKTFSDSAVFNGNVGIGTSNPIGVFADTVVRVAGDSGAEIILRRNDPGVVSGDYIGGFLFNNGDTSGDDPHYAGMIGRAHQIYGPTQLEFYSGRGSVEDSSAVPHMLIKAGTDENPEVGIGIDDPQATLHVKSSDANTKIGIWNSGTAAASRYAQLLLTQGSTFFGASDKSWQLVSTGQSDGTTQFQIQSWNGSAYNLNASFHEDGNVNMHYGIRFGSDTAATNVLDDYEEGTWDADVKDTNDNAVIINSTATSRYVKTGAIVTAFIVVYANSVSAHTFVGTPYIELPYTPGNNAGSYVAVTPYYLVGMGSIVNAYAFNSNGNKLMLATSDTTPFSSAASGFAMGAGNKRFYATITYAV